MAAFWLSVAGAQLAWMRARMTYEYVYTWHASGLGAAMIFEATLCVSDLQALLQASTAYAHWQGRLWFPPRSG